MVPMPPAAPVIRIRRVALRGSAIGILCAIVSSLCLVDVQHLLFVHPAACTVIPRRRLPSREGPQASVNIDCSQVLVQVVNVACPRDGDNPRLLGQEPCEGDLSRRRVLLCRNSLRGFPRIGQFASMFSGVKRSKPRGSPSRGRASCERRFCPSGNPSRRVPTGRSRFPAPRTS